MTTPSHKLVLPADANHHGTLYAGAMLRLMLEAGYATAWKHVGPEANLVLRRVLNMECLRPVPVGVVAEIQGAVLHRVAAYLVCGLVGMPLGSGSTPASRSCSACGEPAVFLKLNSFRPAFAGDKLYAVGGARARPTR